MKDLEKEFVPHPLALRMKALGFKERVLTYYENKTPKLHIHVEGWDFNTSFETCISRPTFSQAFRWFRENYNLHAEPYIADMGAIEYCFQIRDLYSEKYVYDNFVGAGSSYSGTFNTSEEAELACLEKLIEICPSE